MPGPATRIDTPADWLRLVLGLFLVFALFHGSATVLDSDRGQRGVMVAALVVAATAAANWFVMRGRGVSTVRQLGLGTPRARGIAVAGGVSLLMFAFAWAFLRAMGLAATFYPGWLALVPGLFAQGGIAEEVLFRGYLFGHIRAGRTFWRAACLSMLPFVAAHLVLFATMPWPIALASLRTGRPHHLGTGAAALRDPGHGESAGGVVRSRNVRGGVDGGQRAHTSAGVCREAD